MKGCKEIPTRVAKNPRNHAPDANSKPKVNACNDLGLFMCVDPPSSCYAQYRFREGMRGVKMPRKAKISRGRPQASKGFVKSKTLEITGSNDQITQIESVENVVYKSVR